MANTRISDLTASASNLASTDLAPVVQTVGVGPVKMTGLQLAGGLLGSTTFNGSTVTTSSPVLNLTQTWNDGAVTFTGLKFNATDTASAAGSLLLDLQVGGTSQFNLSKAGLGVFKGKVASSFGYSYGNPQFYDASIGTGVGFQIKDSAEAVIYAGGSAILAASSNATGVRLQSTSPLCWSSTSHALNAPDTILTRAAAATLQLGAADAAAPVAQFFKVQSGTAGASATTVSISGTSLTIAGTVTGTIAIGHAVTGTGVSAGTLITAGSGTSWTVNNSQTVGPITAYFNSVGADFTIRGSQGSGPSAGGSLIFQVAPAGSAATTAQNAYSTALTIGSDNNKTATFAGAMNVTSFSYWGSGTKVAINQNGTGDITAAAAGEFSFGSSGVSSPDVKLFRDAANTLALRNGTNAQRFNVYNTYTSSTNYETFKVDWITTANTCLIGTEKGSGGGTARALALQTDGTTRLTIETNGDLTIADAKNIIVGSTTGTKIGTATSQKIGFWNATPIVQPTTGVAEAAFVENSGGTAVNVDSTFGGYTLQQVVQALQNAGLLA